MIPISHSSSAPQHIRMIDQHGQAVPLDVRQDGLTPGLVSPGKRTRFKIRTGAVAYRVNSIVLPEGPEDWHVHNIYVGSQPQFSSLGDSPNDDGVPGAIFAASSADSFFSFQTTQACMDLVIDVAYHGPVEGGALFCCHLQCTAAYADDVSLIDKWKAKWRDLAWRTVNAASLVTLVTSVDCYEALAALS